MLGPGQRVWSDTEMIGRGADLGIDDLLAEAELDHFHEGSVVDGVAGERRQHRAQNTAARILRIR